MTNDKIAGVVNWDQLIPTATPSIRTTTTPSDIIGRIVLIAFPLAGVAMLIYLVYGGYLWMFSSGDPKKLAQAQGMIKTAIIGFFIVFASFWIVQFVAVTLGLEPIIEIFGE